MLMLTKYDSPNIFIGKNIIGKWQKYKKSLHFVNSAADSAFKVCVILLGLTYGKTKMYTHWHLHSYFFK